MCQSITFCLADAVPVRTIARWQDELAGTPDGERARELRGRIDRYKDAGHGDCLFLQSGLAGIVADALTSGDGDAYRLYAWVVMPNHVHVLIGPMPEVDRVDVSSLTQRWKGRTARLINQARGASGTVWQRESWDRWIRDLGHFESVAAYIEGNPLRAGLNGWRWVSGHTIAPAG